MTGTSRGSLRRDVPVMTSPDPGRVCCITPSLTTAPHISTARFTPPKG